VFCGAVFLWWLCAFLQWFSVFLRWFSVFLGWFSVLLRWFNVFLRWFSAFLRSVAAMPSSPNIILPDNLQSSHKSDSRQSSHSPTVASPRIARQSPVLA
jgi:hypothetical protein